MKKFLTANWKDLIMANYEVEPSLLGGRVPAGTELGKILDLHSLAELQIFSAPFEQTAMMLMRPQICTIQGSALVYVVAKRL